QLRSELQFGTMRTNTDAAPLLDGRFAATHDRFNSVNPHYSPNFYRYVHYNACWFAMRCRAVPGDFVIAGVNYGASAKVIYEFVGFPSLGKTMHLVDPLDATADAASARREVLYNTDPDYILRLFPDEHIKLHRQPIPIELGRLAFVYSDTGDIDSDIAALPGFYDALSPGGVWISGTYGFDTKKYRDVLDRLQVTPLWLPSGQGVIIK